MQEIILKGITQKVIANGDILTTIQLDKFLPSLSDAPQRYNGVVIIVSSKHLLPKNGFSHKKPEVLYKEVARQTG